jgi:hypothetical protein
MSLALMCGTKVEVWDEREESRCREATLLAKDDWGCGPQRDVDSGVLSAAPSEDTLSRCPRSHEKSVQSHSFNFRLWSLTHPAPVGYARVPEAREVHGLSAASRSNNSVSASNWRPKLGDFWSISGG